MGGRRTDITHVPFPFRVNAGSRGLLIEELVPGNVVVVETRADLIESELFPEEEQSLGKPVSSRRREFMTGRACARKALGRLGFEPAPIPSGPRGEPIWPEGIVGSITHCRGYRACAVSTSEQIASIGIDAEVHAPLPEGVLESVSSREEREAIAGFDPGVCMDRVLFSAKEAIYKAWFPITERWLDFHEVSLELTDSTFSAQLLVPGPVVDGRQIAGFEGRWRAEDGVVAAAVALPRGQGSWGEAKERGE